jgi:hypothetical protein
MYLLQWYQNSACPSTTGIAFLCTAIPFDISFIYISQINGTRGNAPPTSGGANIEIGGANSGQLVEYTKSWDPRSWSCLHVFEGGMECRNTTLRYNDIGQQKLLIQIDTY